MRTIWNGLTFLAVVNLLALTMLVGWLWKTERLDLDRARAIRSMLAETRSEEQARLAEAEAEVDAAVDAAQAADRAQNPPLPGAIQARMLTHLRSREEEAERRLDAESRRLREELARRERELAQREADVAVRESALNVDEVEQAARDAEAQFRKVVAQYELAAPKTARRWILDLVAAGDRDMAVRYLDAMDERAAKKILNEFKTEDEASLAAELLESVRVLGLAGPGAEDAPDADDPTGTE